LNNDFKSKYKLKIIFFKKNHFSLVLFIFCFIFVSSFKLTLRDVTGKDIDFQELNKTAKSCSLEIEKAGVYFLEFKNEKGRFVKKILVE
jgi:hypothetical protein